MENSINRIRVSDYEEVFETSEICFNTLAFAQEKLRESLTAEDIDCFWRVGIRLDSLSKETRKNGEIRVHLRVNNRLIRFRAGKGENVISAAVENGQLYWKFCRKSKKQRIIDIIDCLIENGPVIISCLANMTKFILDILKIVHS